jgi:hypothetical protein
MFSLLTGVEIHHTGSTYGYVFPLTGVERHDTGGSYEYVFPIDRC